MDAWVTSQQQSSSQNFLVNFACSSCAYSYDGSLIKVYCTCNISTLLHGGIHQAQYFPLLLPPLHLGLCPSPACTPCSGNTDAGLVMSTTWTTVTSPKISSIATWQCARTASYTQLLYRDIWQRATELISRAFESLKTSPLIAQRGGTP